MLSQYTLDLTVALAMLERMAAATPDAWRIYGCSTCIAENAVDTKSALLEYMPTKGVVEAFSTPIVSIYALASASVVGAIPKMPCKRTEMANEADKMPSASKPPWMESQAARLVSWLAEALVALCRPEEVTASYSVETHASSTNRTRTRLSSG